ncbi:MAG: CinA family protein [bacterium]
MKKQKIEEIIGFLLFQNKKKLSVAESCTGGLISQKITSIAGSSNYFESGLVTYSDYSKIKLLKISEKIIKKYGAVSEEIALLMAEKVRKLANTDYGLGITGIAGPSGETKLKPIGLVFIALSNSKNNICKKYNFFGTRNIIRNKTYKSALNMLKKDLLQK